MGSFLYAIAVIVGILAFILFVLSVALAESWQRVGWLRGSARSTGKATRPTPSTESWRARSPSDSGNCQRMSEAVPRVGSKISRSTTRASYRVLLNGKPDGYRAEAREAARAQNRTFGAGWVVEREG